MYNGKENILLEISNTIVTHKRGENIMKKASPYTPGAGTMPPYLAGREQILATAQGSLESAIAGYMQKPVIYYGLRGVGKTVLLNAIEDMAYDLDILYEHIEISDRKSFLTQITTASNKILHRLSFIEAAKAAAKKSFEFFHAFQMTYSPNDQTFTMGLDSSTPYITSNVLSEDLTDLFLGIGRTAKKANKVVCFFIDEIQYMKNDELDAMIQSLHRVNQKGYPIIMYGAGLPKVVSLLSKIKSYAERLFDYEYVDSLTAEDAKRAITEPAQRLGISYKEDAIKAIIQLTKGYPYFIQELCDVLWKNTDTTIFSEKDVTIAMPIFIRKMDDSFFKTRYEKCTRKEQDFLIAMVKCGELPCTIGNVATVLKTKSSSISPTRAQLISKGIIYSTHHGEIDFTVPLFDEYLRRINPDLKIGK